MYAFALLASFFMVAKDVVSKRVSFTVTGAGSGLASFLYAIPFYVLLISYLYLTGVPIMQVSGAFWSLVVLRALADAAGETFKMYAFSNGDLSMVSILLSFMPIFTVLIAPLVTNDPFHLHSLFGASLVVVGGVIATYKTPNARTGVIFALLAVVCMSLNHSLDRLAVQTGHPIFSGFMMTFLAMIFVYPIYLKFGRKGEIVSNWFWLRGAFEVLFMVSKLYALTELTATQVMLVLRLSVVLSVLAGFFYFKEQNVLRRLLAAIITLIGVWIGV